MSTVDDIMGLHDKAAAAAAGHQAGCCDEATAAKHRDALRDAVRAALAAPAPRPEPTAYLLRDLAAELGIDCLRLAYEIKAADFGIYSVNMAVPANVCAIMRRRLGQRPTPEMVERLIAAVEGECDGLAISTATAEALLVHALQRVPEEIEARSVQAQIGLAVAGPPDLG